MASESKEECPELMSVVVRVNDMEPQTVNVKMSEEGAWVAENVGCSEIMPAPTSCLNFGVYYCAEWTGWRPKMWEVFETDEEARMMCRTLNMLFRSTEAPFSKTWVTPSLPAGSEPIYSLGGTVIGGILEPEKPAICNVLNEAEMAAARLRENLFQKKARV